MARIHWPLSDIDEAHGVTGKCSLCGKRSVAFWIGDTTIEVCTGCAETSLVALIADSVCHPEDWNGVYRTVDRLKANFWRALAGRLAVMRRGTGS